MRAKVRRLGAVRKTHVNPLLGDQVERPGVALVAGVPSAVLHVGFGRLAVLTVAAAHGAIGRHHPLVVELLVNCSVLRGMAVLLPPRLLYHSHQREEEWIYILSGHGVAEIDGAEFEVGAGDFMGFPTPSVAHHLRNTGDDDLVYLAGGENLDIEIAEFPRLGKRMIRREGAIEIYDFSDAKPFEALDT